MNRQKIPYLHSSRKKDNKNINKNKIERNIEEEYVTGKAVMMRRIAILNRLVRESLTKKETLEQTPEGGEGVTRKLSEGKVYQAERI